MKSGLHLALALLAAAALACGEAAARSVHAQDRSGKDAWNACRILTPSEIEALTEKDIVLANVEEAAPER